MSSNVKYNKSSGLIEIVYSGKLTESMLRETVRKRIAIQNETGAVGVLADASRVEVAPEIFALFDLPSRFFSEENADRRTLIAMVLPDAQELKEKGMFLETASRNRGWVMQNFEDRQSAIAWLREHTTFNKANDSD